MVRVEERIGDWIGKGFDIYKNNMGPMLIMALILVGLTMLSGGILAGPLSAGFVMVVLRAARGEKNLQAGDIFKGFDFFVPALLLYLCWGVGLAVAAAILSMVPCIGWILTVVLSAVVATIVWFAIFLVVDQKMDFWPASMRVIETIKANPLPLIGFGFLTGLLASLGSILCIVGVVLTVPVGYCIFAVAYPEVFGEGETIPAEAVETPAEATEPPPASPEA